MIVVWGRRSSSNVQKVLWTAAELGLDFERKAVGGSFGGNNAPEYLAISPRGLVPALQDGDLSLFESNAIVRYLAARHGNGGFMPWEWKARAAAETWMEWQQHAYTPVLSEIFMNEVRLPMAMRGATASARERLRKELATADNHLASNRFFAGDALSFGDIVMGIMHWRGSLLGCDATGFAHVERWFADLQTRKAYRDWVMVPDFGRTPESWEAHEKLLG